MYWPGVDGVVDAAAKCDVTVSSHNMFYVEAEQIIEAQRKSSCSRVGAAFDGPITYDMLAEHLNSIKRQSCNFVGVRIWMVAKDLRDIIYCFNNARN